MENLHLASQLLSAPASIPTSNVITAQTTLLDNQRTVQKIFACSR